jgi:exodeoxyribonuclease VII large subunit
MTTANAAGERILSVVEITRLIKGSLEAEFPAVWVRGEISGMKRADSGHLYFSLKEGRDAVVSCVMWRGPASRLPFDPRDGQAIEAFGGIEVYVPRGQYQLVVREMRPAGLGALLLQLEELRRRLAAEGLFDAGRKRPLPRFPRRIGLVTSPVGAAVRDMVKVLRARWPAIRLVLAPVRVQGEGAAAEIAAAIERFNRHGEVDVLIVGRGGGSIEDLWAFNEEPVVRAIAGSAIPVISAVGHEVDTTLADFAADVRAATPSNAAELAVPSAAEIARQVAALDQRLDRAVRDAVAARRRRLESLLAQYGFRRQRDFVDQMRQRIDVALERVRQSLRGALAAARARLARVRESYGLREFARVLAARRESARERRERLTDALVTALQARRTRLGAALDRLRALSPRQVMERGYCLVRRADGTLVRAAGALAVGETIAVEFARGEADARVERIRLEGRDGEEPEAR